MRSLFRRLRGLLGLGAFSASAWAIFGAVVGSVMLLVDPASVDAGEGPLWTAYYLGRTGFVAGLAAGALIAVLGRRTALLDLRMRTVVALGAVAGATLPWIAFAPRAMLPFLVVLSAGTAASALALARRGERQSLDQSREQPVVGGTLT
jgi:hypothetical protein